MTYNITVNVEAPIELYDAAHAAIWEAVGTSVDGLILHIGRPTATGFQVIEIWESKEQCDQFDVDVANPAIARVSGGQPMPPIPRVEFDVHGLVIPNGGIMK